MIPTPYIDPELIKWLDKQYPEQSPRKGDLLTDVMFQGGQRDVVRRLKVELERQEKINVSRQETPQARHPS